VKKFVFGYGAKGAGLRCIRKRGGVTNLQISAQAKWWEMGVDYGEDCRWRGGVSLVIGCLTGRGCNMGGSVLWGSFRVRHSNMGGEGTASCLKG